MTRDGMPRAYLRLDPNIDQTHPDINGFVRLMCAAARQPERGRFRNLAQVQALFGKHRTHQMMTREDIVTLPDGRIYVEGWDEWQEGDHTVTERMKRMRARRRNKAVTRVTPPASPGRNGVTTDAVEHSTEGTSSTGVGDDFPPNPPPSGGRGLRANGTSPRQLAKAAQDAEKAERERRKRAVQELNLRYYRGEISEADHAHALAELGQVPA